MRCQDYFYKKQNEVFIVKTCTSQVKRCTKDNTLKKCKLLFTGNSAPACAATQQPHFKGSKDSVLHFYCRHVCQTLILKQHAATSREGVILMRHSALSWRPFGNQHLSKHRSGCSTNFSLSMTELKIFQNLSHSVI